MLTLLLCHDHFFAKTGIAANAKHPLRAAIERHRSRLQSEFTRARLKRRCGSVEALVAVLDKESSSKERRHPRWVRVNTLVATDGAALLDRLPGARSVDSLEQVLQSGSQDLTYAIDNNVPNLYAFSPSSNLTKSTAYAKGEVILQDKASCFPAWLLLGGQEKDTTGDVIDGCAAPGNKTTHVAAIMGALQIPYGIFACEKDEIRSKTLKTMTLKAGAKHVEVLANQDFLALDPQNLFFSNVTHLLLDPSCSGSGIVNRQDIPKLALPVDPRAISANGDGTSSTRSKKRKRDQEPVVDSTTELETTDEEAPTSATLERLQKLSNLQTHIVEHAMKFPAARRITYSTCSIHEQENEVVVSRLLKSEVAQKQGWKILPREEQIKGMQMWRHRGVNKAGMEENTLDESQLDACIRCYPDDEEGTMGFFVCAFTREPRTVPANSSNGHIERPDDSSAKGPPSDEEWEGFE